MTFNYFTMTEGLITLVGSNEACIRFFATNDPKGTPACTCTSAGRCPLCQIHELCQALLLFYDMFLLPEWQEVERKGVNELATAKSH